jgi:hypothetical protein
MNKPSANDLSRLRQRLRQTEDERARQVQIILEERGPLLRGTYLEYGIRCGKPGCRCTQGQLHDTAVLQASEQGKTFKVYVPQAEREGVQKLNRRYQRFRMARAAVARLGQQALKLADELQRALTQLYPPQGREPRKRSGSTPKRGQEP